MATTDNNSAVWLGIDFGTTHCSVAVWDSKRGYPKWIRLDIALVSSSGGSNNKKGRLVPSHMILRQRQGREEEETEEWQNVSKFITTTTPADDANNILQAAMGRYASQFLLKEEKWHDARVSSLKRHFLMNELVTVRPMDSNVQNFNAIDLMAALLSRLRTDAEAYIQQKYYSQKKMECRNVVLTVPAHYSRKLKDQMKVAARRAGFTGHVSTMVESTAAAMAYYGLFASGAGKKKTILVLDMGGGTTDVTIARQQEQEQFGFRVLVTTGNDQLGGDDMDRALVQHFALDNSKKWQWHCQKAKEELCQRQLDGDENATVLLNDTKIAVSVQDFEQAIEPILLGVKQVVQRALDQYHDLSLLEQHEASSSSSGSQQQMDEIILIGGATRVPAVRRMIQETFFPNQELCTSINPMSAVAQGAAIQAAILSKQVPMHQLESALMMDTNPHPIGVLSSSSSTGEQNFVEILSKDMPLPAMGYATFQLADPLQAGVTVHAVEAISTLCQDGQDPKVHYEPVGEFTFLLHRMNPTATTTNNNTGRSVDIGMTLKTDGALVVSIFDPNDPEHIRKRERLRRNKETDGSNVIDYTPPQEPFSTEQLLLVVSCILVFILYVAAKLAFLSEPMNQQHEDDVNEL